MAVTKTTRLNLAKQALGDLNWRVGLDQGFEDADSRLFKEGTGSPDGVVTSDYVGQRFFQTDGPQWWTAPLAASTAWVADAPLSGDKATRDAIVSPATGQWFLRTDIDPGGVDVYNGASWDRRLGPRSGQIEMWTGSVAATANYLNDRPGWALCNGNIVNGITTPNLVDKFVLGYGAEAINTTGGASSKTLALAEMPAHRHLQFRNEVPVAASIDLLATKGVNQGNLGGASYRLYPNQSPDIAEPDLGLGGLPKAGADPWAAQGAQTAFDNRPAFYALAYIMFVDYA